MAKPLLMAERHEWWGKWWLPGDDSPKHGGLATFDPDHGITLRLSGGFDHHVFDEPRPGVKSFRGETRTFPIVFGDVGGTYITLVDCAVSSSRGPLFGDEPTDQTLTARVLLRGCHLDDINRGAFVAIETEVENLPLWSSETAMTGTMTFPTGKSGGSPTGTFEIGPVEPRTVVAGGDKYALMYSYTVPQLATTRTRHEVVLRDEPYFRVDFAAPTTIDAAVRHAGELRDLVTLAIGRPCGTTRTRLFLPPTPGAYPDDHPYAKQDVPIEVLARQAYRATPHEDAVPHHEVLFTLNDIGFDTVIPSWIEARKKYRAASDLVLGLWYNTGQYLETRTISAVAAAESFHRALDTEPPMTSKAFKALRKTLVEAAPDEHKQMVRERFGRNEPTLKDRLLDLAHMLNPELRTKILPDVETWANRAKNSRNVLAHEGSSGSHDYVELYAVAEVTAAVVTLNLLDALAIPTAALVDRMTSNALLRRAASLSKDHLAKK